MPALEVANNPQDDENEDETALVPAGPVIGIIYPPPEVRNIVDKTASFVARNGPEFEARIRQNELGNPKFNFLSSGDPYHAYYQHKVKDFRDGKVAEPNAMPPGLGGAMQRLTVTAATQQRQQQLLRAAAEPPPPTEAPPDFEFIADPPSISALDLDIVKLTAQFVARNGRQFLTNLMNREQRNYQFDFLRPQHSLFHYFTRLLEQYTKVLLPPKELLPRLIEEAGSTQTVLNGAKSRAAWLSHQLAQRQKEEQKLERERVAYASIDWHDFVVVETVDYQPMELGSFPPPTTPDEVGARVLMQERIDDGGVEEIEMQLESDDDDDDSDGDKEKEEGLSKMEDRTGHNKQEIRTDNTQVQDMEEESSSSDTEDSDSDSDDDRRRPKDSSSSMQPPAMPPQLDKVVVKKYDPKQAKRESTKVAGSAAGEEWLISPITGERIPAHKVQEHVRIGLLDSRWLEQRDRALGERGAQDAVLAQGSAIEASLKQLAERRTDIFGVGDEETAIGKKIGEEEVRKDDRVTWDGHTSSVEAATRAARANITLEEQIHQIHKVKGLLPDEEKEKIGPKPIGGGHQQGSSQPSGQSQQSQNQGQSQNQSQNIPQPKQQSHMQSAQMHHPSMQPQQMPKMIPQPVVPPMGGILPQMPPLMVMSSMKPMNTMPMPPMKPPMNPIPPINPMPPMPPIMGVGPGPGFGFGGPQMRSAPPPPAEQVQLQVIDDEPPAKRARTEDSLIPEQHFMQLHPGIISFVVAVPNMPERTEWSLSGQRVPLRLPVSATVATLKAKLNQAVGMQPAKQKLHMEGLFFKDSNTLAFYNVAPGSTVNLQVKERGGRKK